MEVIDFEDRERNGLQRPLSAQLIPNKNSYGAKIIQKRPQSSSGPVKKWKNNSNNGLNNPFREENRFRHQKKSLYAVRQVNDNDEDDYYRGGEGIRRKGRRDGVESPTTNDDDFGIINEARLVDSFWPGNRLGKRPILPTVSAENIKIEKKLSRYIPKLGKDLGDPETLKSLLLICRLHADCVALMNRDLQRISDQTVSVECAQQSMYCIGHMNLICQAHESLKRYCFQYSEINQNVRKYHEEEAIKLQNNVKEQIDLLNKKIRFLTPPELPKSGKKKGKDDEGVVGRYTLAARQRNREINYSSASRQLQDLYTQMMDGQDQKKKRSNKKSRLRSRKTIKNGGGGGANKGPDLDHMIQGRDSSERASMLEQVYRSFNASEKVEAIASLLSEMGEKERKNLNSDYIMDLPEEERLEILRLMIKDVDVDDRSMMVENLLEGLSGNERKEMIVEELDTLTDKQVLGLVTTLMAESLTEDNRKEVMSGVLVELSTREREETAVDLMHLSQSKNQRQLLLKFMIDAMPEKERNEFNKILGGEKETNEVGTFTGEDFPKSKKSGKSGKKRKGAGLRAKHIAELPASVRSKHWAKYLVEKPAHVKHRKISEKRADKLIGHIYKKKISSALMDEKNQEPDSMCETVYHYFNQKYGMKKMAEEFIYGMVKCAEKFEEGRSKNLRIHTFGVLLGKIHTDSYSPIITESVMAFLSHLYPVEKVGTKLDEGYGKCFVLLSVCLKALTNVLVPFQGDSVEEDKRKELEKNRFYIPEKTFEKCKNTIVQWATPAKDVVKINKEMKKLGSQEVINVDHVLHLIMDEYLKYNDKNRRELVEALLAFDTDGDGKINFHEFKTFMESCHSMYIPITERVISRLWMEMQEHLETSGEENFTPQLAAETFAAASMHYDIHPPSKSEINKLIADRPNIKAEDDSDIDDDDEED